MKSIAFGLERVALPAVTRPWIVAGFLALVFAVVGYGLTKPTFDDNLRNIFGGSTAVLETYLEATKEFVDPENQLIILVEGASLGEPKTLARLRELQFELQFVDGVQDVFSLFALRAPPEELADETFDAPLIVDDSIIALSPEVITKIRSHPILGEKLLSEDGTAMIFVVTPQEAQASLATLRALAAAVESTAAEALDGTGATFTLTGFPSLRINVVDVLLHDTVLLNTAGAALGLIMNFVIFGSFTAAFMVAVPAILSGLAIVGGLGAFGVPVNVLSNVVPVLVMILGFANSMHLCRAWRLNRESGLNAADAAYHSISEIGPACILAAATTSVAFSSLIFSDVKIVSDFGMVGAVGCMVGAFIVLLMHGLMALTVGRFWKTGTARSTAIIDWLGKPSALTGQLAADYARPICIIAFVLVVVFGAMYSSIRPEYSVQEHLSRDHPANAALTRIDQKLGGAFPIHVVVPLDGANPTAAENLEKIGRVHRAIAAVDGVSEPLSLWSLVQWLGDADAPDPARLNQVLEDLSPETRQRFIGTNGSALISTNIRDAPVAVTDALVGQIESAVAAAGGSDVIVTGVSVAVAREATRTISNLNGNLLGAILSGLMVILVAFRSWRIAVTSIIPNILPLLGTGTIIFLFGDGVHFSSILGLTVAFGIAVDGTIHYLNGFIRVADDSRSLRENLIGTSRMVGPQLFGMTAVIVVGLVTTQFSQMPNIVLFGRLVAATLVIGLVGDLVVLPALMAGAAKRWFTRHPTMQPAARGAA